MTGTDDELASALAAHLDAVLGIGGHRVEHLARLSGGASRETFSFDLLGPDGDDRSRPLILQRVRRGALSPHSMPEEATLLRAAAAAGVPVPAVVTADGGGGIAGSSFVVVERLPGETLARRIQRDERYAAARRVLVGQCGAALAAVHRIPTGDVAHLRRDEPVTQLRQLLDAMGEPHPAFELALRWLEERRGEERAPCVVHGDFRLGNLLVDEAGLRAVLDWELAHIGEPAEDLGWFTSRAWRFGQEAPVAGLGAIDELLDAYEGAGGVAVEPEELRWWQALGTLRWGVICIVQARAHLDGASRSVELAAIGRRVAEAEYDVLRLIDASLVPPTTDADDDGGSRRSDLYGRPTASELLDAVAEYLRGDVSGATEGRVRFHARVAANAVDIVGREVRLGPGARRRHEARLVRLGCDSDGELAAAIRAGAFAGREPEVRAEVFAATVDKLLVADPGYL